MYELQINVQMNQLLPVYPDYLALEKNGNINIGHPEKYRAETDSNLLCKHESIKIRRGYVVMLMRVHTERPFDYMVM